MNTNQEEEKMEKPDAAVYYHGVERYNCAQAVLRAYTPAIGMSDENQTRFLEQFSQFGGGRAPEGECGALFAAKAILSDSDAKQKVEDDFVRAAGSTKCSDIRGPKTITCAQCVQVASDAVYSQVCEGRRLQCPAV
jgi:hypothetical protein